MGPERLQLEPTPESTHPSLRLNGLIRYAIMNQVLGSESAQRILSLNQERGHTLIDEDILCVIPHVDLPERPIAQGLRRVSDFKEGQPICVLAENYETFHFCTVSKIDFDTNRVLASASKNVDVYIPPDFIGLFSESDYNRYMTSQREPRGGKPHSFSVNLELSRLLATEYYRSEPGNILTRRIRRHFNFINTWFYTLHAEDLSFTQSQLDTVNTSSKGITNDEAES